MSMWHTKDGKLYKKFELDDFKAAISLINQVAVVAEELNHHPKIINSYNTVEILLSTHSEGDIITVKDHQLAERIDELQNMKQVNYTLHTDGGSRGNPGPSAIGYVITGPDGETVEKTGKYVGETTNNQAEYMALRAGLERCFTHGITNLSVFMDSELIVKQVGGLYKVKNVELKPLFEEVKKLLAKFDTVSVEHVRREHNQQADQLVNEALDESVK